MANRLRRVTFVVASALLAACGAILGIEDREPLLPGDEGGVDNEAGGSEAAPSEAGEGSASDAGLDVPLVPDASCETDTCKAAGGTCAGGACRFDCAGPCPAAIVCPPNTDCQVVCPDGKCAGSTCTGGQSCTYECFKTSCTSAKCTSQSCAFHCGGVDSCGNIACTAAVDCRLDCTGEGSCDVLGGISGTAGASCAIRCTGKTSCGGSGGDGLGSPIRCDAPDSSVTCGTAQDTCKDGIPSCGGAYCRIDCQGGDSCEDGYCCDAGTCVKLGRDAAVLCN